MTAKMAKKQADNFGAAYTSFDGAVSVDPASVLRHTSLGRMSDVNRQYARTLIAEKLRRRTEASSLYEPQPEQLRFHKSNAKERILRGSNRAGKTLTASAEVAWLLARRHPYLDYPKTGRLICVGESETHIAETMWHKLTRESPSLRMIKDEQTKQWRAYRPWQDGHRKDESRPMGPLLPERLWKGRVAYEDRGKDVPKMVRLSTGWDIMFCSGYSKPPQGVDVDVVFFDEEIPKDDWYREMAARLVDRNGKFIWSATPLAAAEALWNLHLRCEEYSKCADENPLAEEFLLTMDGNRYITDELKNELKEKYKHDPEHYRVRILGEYLVTSFRMYPTFNRNQHVCEPVVIGDDWTRYASIDPGNTVCAVTFYAVPPDESHIYCYDELYIRNCTSSIFAEKMRHKVQGHNFQAFICDFHGQARTEAAGETIGQQYSRELQRLGVASIATGSSFWMQPVHDKLVGCDKVRELLNPSPIDGRPKLLFYPHVEHTMGEIERYHKKRRNGIALDEPEQLNMHCVDTIRYLAVHGGAYVKPLENRVRMTPVMQYWLNKQKKNPGDGSIYLSSTGVG